jgi:hypothetical protein
MSGYLSLIPGFYERLFMVGIARMLYPLMFEIE